MSRFRKYYRLFAGLFFCLSTADIAWAAGFNEDTSALKQAMFAPYALEQYDFRDDSISILSLEDRKLYSQIFALQDDARWNKAQKLIAQIKDPILMGYVDFQRLMHPTKYRAHFSELADWLDDYAQLSGAKRVYVLAKRRKINNNRKLRKPDESGISLHGKSTPIVPHASSSHTKKKSRSVRSIQWRVDKLVSKGKVSYAWRQLKRPTWRNKLSDEEYIQTLGDIAKGYVIYQKDDLAISVADEALKLDANYPSQAYWWAGLAAWRSGDMKSAAEFFTFLGNHKEAIPALSAASSFWAWRSLLRLEKITEAHQALVQTTIDPSSFYGQLARHALNIPLGLDFSFKGNPQNIKNLIQRFPILKRILALAEVGKFSYAQNEVNRLKFGDNHSLISSMIYVADRAGLANMAIKLGSKLKKLTGKRIDISKYPVPRWRYHDHYYIDRALLYAMIRKESLFRTTATSRVGARGLMQLMPATARLMQRRLKITGNNIHEPKMNLSLGQEYLRHLLTLPEINYNLIYTLIGYNAGPGRLRDWRENVPMNHDPLLFIETIPVRETREYVENVLADMWIYRKRLKQDTPSLHTILEGKWPLYQRLDKNFD